jgi:CheY-specific phosphatase CheX
MNYLNPVRAKFQLPPQPDAVEKIVGLVNGKNKSSMDEIVKIIDTERRVPQRLITMAFPKAAARLGATVQMATSRLGINRVIVVIIGDLLTQAVIETFQTMAAMTLELEDPAAVPEPDQFYLTGTVKFTGKTNGQVTLAFPPPMRMLMVARLLGGDMDDTHPPEVIHDVIGEIVNIVTGNLQSLLCDAGFPSEVGLPEVRYQTGLPRDPMPGGTSDQFYFRQGMYNLAVNLSIDPKSS